MADYQAALKIVLDHEGGYQALTSDAGNAGGHGTNRGITFATLSDWRKKQGKAAPTDADVKTLSLQETADIYQALYWRPVGGELLTDQAIATVLFDAGVVMGPGTVVKIAQGIAAAVSGQGVLADGLMGPKTAGIINGLQRRSFLEPLCYKLQGRFLDCIAATASNVSWEKTWMRRACDWLCLIY
jgi:lysozyme family protein